MRIGHHSARFDRSADAFVEAAKLVADQCSLCTWTEVTHDGNVVKARDWFENHGWGTWQPGPGNPAGSDESALVWDKEVWAVEEKAKASLSDLRYHREGGSLAPFTVALAGLFHRLGTDERWVVATLHLPANTTDGQGSGVHWNAAGNSDRGDVFRDVMKNLGPWVKNLRQQWERTGASTLIAADWNQRCEDPWFRNHVLDWMPAEFKVSSGPYPDTINVSCYDWWIQGQRVKPDGDGWAIKSPASDHKLIVRRYQRTD